jgi:long-chain acyl-CoA synthetase
MVLNTNIASVLDRPADDAPERAAMVVGGETVTYDRLLDEANRWAATLATTGTRSGDRVALVDWGGLRSVAATLGAAHLGAATAQINPLLTSTEQAQLRELSGCGPVGVGAGGIEAPATDGTTPARARGADTAALILFTSGTTGLPKPVPLTHDGVLARLAAYRPAFDPQRPPNTTIMCVPSFHVGGMLGLLLSLWSGDTTVVQPRFDAGEWLELVERHRVASAFLVPTMLTRILDHPDFSRRDLSSLLAISYGAAAAPIPLVRRAMTALPSVGFANVFGQTETLGAYTTLSPADHHDPRKIGSVGRPLPGVEVRVVDTETGLDAPDGAVGELWVRSGQTVADGWLHTGDLGRRQPDGYLYPVGRLTETINRAGEKFGPIEVSEALRDHAAVADVAVAGVPDEEMGERVGAAIVLQPGATQPTVEDLRAFCRTRLASYKLPEVVVFVDALPYNELGKLGRRATAELIAREAAR